VGTTKPAGHRRLWLFGTAAAAVTGTLVVLWVITRSPESRLALDSLPEGVTAHTIQGVPVFLVSRHSRDVKGYLDAAQHLANEQLWWCPAEEVFVSPFHGELFDAEGHLLAGPAVRDLDRVAVTVTTTGVVVVDPFTVRQGMARRVREASMVDISVWTAYRSWSGRAAGEPSTFCQQRISGEGNPHK
jgi:nitrite reductase/ring-hydroxylating ferredoxin subunit